MKGGVPKYIGSCCLGEHNPYVSEIQLYRQKINKHAEFWLTFIQYSNKDNFPAIVFDGHTQFANSEESHNFPSVTNITQNATTYIIPL